jgi:hypothetical protein
VQFALSSKWFRMSAQFGLDPDVEEFVSNTECGLDTCDTYEGDAQSYVGFGFGVCVDG